MSHLFQVETLVLELLLIVSVVAIVGRRFRIPYTVALVLAGLALSFRPGEAVELTPDLILSLFLPPLVFEAALHINLDTLLKSLPKLVLLAVGGVIINMLLVGAVVGFGGGLPLGLALVFGALIAATDPVAVVAIFRKLGVPKRLEVLLEGESLLNDGTAIVLFGLALTAFETGHFNALEAAVDFVRVTGGGIVIGIVLGWLVSRLIARINDHLVETTLTTVLAFGSYLAAEQFHFSGVLAVVLAGLVNGNIGPRGMSPTTRIVVLNFWEYVAFLANSAVFLIIGLRLDLPRLVQDWQLAVWAIAGVLISRAVVVYLLSRVGRDIPGAWRHVMFWGGLRGAIALALALTLPPSMGEVRNTVETMAFTVVLFTILVQGLSMDWLLRRLGVVSTSEEKLEYERRHARALASRSGYEHVQQLHREGLISTHTWERLRPVLQRRTRALTAAVQEVMAQAPEMMVDELMTAQRESLRAQRSTLASLRRDGVIGDETYEDLATEIDLALEGESDDLTGQMLAGRPPAHVDQVVFAVIQDKDLESAVNALAVRGILSTRLQSSGGFLRRPNHLLMIGVAHGRLDQAVRALQSSCRSRVEYIVHPGEPALAEMTEAQSVEIQGATVFSVEVERYEVI
jgi:CPA1 family monovalent cation:H+ antiporter